MDKVVKVQIRNVSSSPQKARLVADVVRGMRVDKALATLKFLNKKAAMYVKKALESGVANAKTVLNVTEPSALVISHISIDEGMKRRSYRPVSKGRAGVLVKQKSHINLEIRSK